MIVFKKVKKEPSLPHRAVYRVPGSSLEIQDTSFKGQGSFHRVYTALNKNNNNNNNQKKDKMAALNRHTPVPTNNSATHEKRRKKKKKEKGENGETTPTTGEWKTDPVRHAPRFHPFSVPHPNVSVSTGPRSLNPMGHKNAGGHADRQPRRRNTFAYKAIYRTTRFHFFFCLHFALFEYLYSVLFFQHFLLSFQISAGFFFSLSFAVHSRHLGSNFIL
eukprot:gene10728-7458_t